MEKNMEMLIEKYKQEMIKTSSRAKIFDEEKNKKEPEKAKEYFGFLRIKAFTGNDAYPVDTALIRVYDENGKLIFEGYTDQSGIISGIRLKTVNGENSESPTEKQKYAKYKIIASHPDFDTAEYDNVPIFDSVESVQPVDFELSNGKKLTFDETGNYPGEEEYGK